MRYFTLGIIIVVAAAIGVLVGVQLAKPTGTTLAVTTQPREDQIVIFWDGNFQPEQPEQFETLRPAGSETTPLMVALDAKRYPQQSQFRLEAALTYESGPQGTNCFRLFNLTSNSAVVGSDICVPAGDSPHPAQLVRSEPFILEAGQHNYGVQGMVQCGGELCRPSLVWAARIIAEWEEPLATAGKLPATGAGDIVEAGSQGKPSGSPLPLEASVALGVLVLGAGGLYVVKLRRG